MSRFRARPYAAALHQVVRADHPKRIDDVIVELEALAAVVATVPDFLRVLVTPLVSPDAKTEILERVLDALQVKEPTRRFAHVVQLHYRMEHMGLIAEAYREEVDRSLGRVRARVETASLLPPAGRAAIESLMAEITGAAVISDYVENPELLAGFRVQVGSKVFDGSLVGQLDRLSRQTFTTQR